MTRARGRRDANHAEIRDAFRRLGCAVWDTADLGGGFPDLAVYMFGQTFLVEVKSPGGKLTGDERKFWDSWPGPLLIVRSVDEVERLIKAGLVTHERL